MTAIVNNIQQQMQTPSVQQEGTCYISPKGVNANKQPLQIVGEIPCDHKA